MLYKVLKVIVSFVINIYYKEFKIHNRNRLDYDGPVILVANHPNTLMDAWIVGLVSKKPVHFMAKATFFSTPFKQKLLKKLYMIPINRKSDSKIQSISNQDSFTSCYEILENKQVLAIFPEGSSFSERVLRELKTGAARIALEAENRNEGKLNLRIIPLGINYLQPEKFRSNVLVNVGKPIVVSEFYEKYNDNKSLTAKKLTELIRVRLEQSLAYTDSKEEQLLVEKLHTIFSSKYIRSYKKGVEADVELLKQIRNSINEIQLTKSWKQEEIENKADYLISEINRLGIKSSFLDRKFRMKMFSRQIISSIIFLIIFFPIFLFGFIHNFIQYRFTDFLVPKISKDVEYYAPLAILVSMIVYPLFYAFFLWITYTIIDLDTKSALLFIVIMIVTGLLSIAYWKYFKHILSKLLFMKNVLKRKNKILELQNVKQELYDLLFVN